MKEFFMPFLLAGLAFSAIIGLFGCLVAAIAS